MDHLSKLPHLSRLVTIDELQLHRVLLDDTRASILEKLASTQVGMTASQLAEEFGLKLPTIMSHLKKLEKVGAVRPQKRRGRRVNRPVTYYRAALKIGAFK